MLDVEILEQLKTTFERLTGTVTLDVSPSTHADLGELLRMLEQIASTSDKIKITQSDPSSPIPSFGVKSGSKPARIIFKGIPGGHEFTSLILAILNSDGKGRLPDEGVISRVRQLKGPIHLKTYVSLSCENCPEVVQALNLIASLHPEFHHEMIDGNYVQSEVDALGIQGVPSVILGSKLIHSGKISFLELLKKLEDQLGTTPLKAESADLGQFDVAVIGGGPAGVSAAIYSVRKGLKTVLIAEKFGGQVQETKGIENMISISYTEGPKFAAQLGEHLRSYPVKVLEHRRVSSIEEEASAKKLCLESGETLLADRIIVATGAQWRQLGIPGEKEHIGQGVAFCAHCDGPFYKDKKVVVVGGGNSGVEAAIDLAGIASQVTLVEYSDKLKADGVLIDKLKSLKNASVLLNVKSKQIRGDGKKVVALEYEDRTTQKSSEIVTDGVFVQIGLLPNTQFIKGLVELSPNGEIQVDPKGRTSVSGIYAAGDVTTIPFKQIVTAMGDGAKVALTAFEDRLHT